MATQLRSMTRVGVFFSMEFQPITRKFSSHVAEAIISKNQGSIA